MKRIFSLYLLILFLSSLITTLGLCQDASEVLEKMIEAQGGRKTLERIKDSILSGTMDIIPEEKSGSLTVYQKEPDKMRMDLEAMGMVFTQACDGKTTWQQTPQTGGPLEMTDKAAEYFKRGSLGNDAFLYPDKYGITYAYKGKEKIGGKDYLILEQTYSDGFKTTIWVDAKTYLTYKSKTLGLDESGTEIEVETHLSAYKEVEGVMIAHSFLVFQNGKEYLKMWFTEITFNSGLEDSLFKMND